jgi:hypothetical protein
MYCKNEGGHNSPSALADRCWPAGGRGRNPISPITPILHRPAAVLPPTSVGVVRPVSQTHTTRTTPTS